jgi:iron complex outermembrane receptor protein
MPVQRQLVRAARTGLARRRLPVRSGCLILSMTVLPALAQETMESVVVSGTRITRPGMSSSGPIASFGADQLEPSLPVALEEFIKDLPAAAPAIGPGTNNGANGGATLDLRGLGANRTLLLVNGRRLVPFNLDGTADSNAIPLALISRVDIMTGGASVVYGADAISGVVNVILKRHFSGVDLSSSYGAASATHDAVRRRTDLTVGGDFADRRGNLVLTIGHTGTDPLTQGARPYGVVSLDSLTGAATGSGTTLPAAFASAKGPGGTDALAGTWQVDPASGALKQPVVPYNFNPLNYYATGLARTQLTALGEFKLNEQAQLYADLLATDSTVDSALAASGTFASTFAVPIGNPFIPAAMRAQLCLRRGIARADCVPGNATIVPLLVNRRFTELGPRLSQFTTRTRQYTLGLQGALAERWRYDAYASGGNVEQTLTRENSAALSKVTQALNAVEARRCVDPANGCVPLNVFGADGSITPDMLAFIRLAPRQRQTVRQTVGALALSGEIGAGGPGAWLAAPASVAFALEQRSLDAATASDAASQIQGEVLGPAAPTPDRAGAFRLREGALEALLPLLVDRAGRRLVEVELGYRRSELNVGARGRHYGSWKAGGQWQPSRTLRLRAMTQTAARAPNINELFAPPTTGVANLAIDPCQGQRVNRADANTAGTLSNLCVQSGVPLANLGVLAAPSAGQINRQQAGNRALGAEQARTVTLGMAWTPVEKLEVMLDAYRIAIGDAISSPSTSDVVDACYDSARNPGRLMNDACRLIGRNPINGSFNGVEAIGVRTPLSNRGTQATSGIDLNLAYQLAAAGLGLEPRFGRWLVSLGLNQTRSFALRPGPDSPERDCLGYYSIACGAPHPRRKLNQRTDWQVGHWSIGYNWRHDSGAREEPGGTDFLAPFASIAPSNYVDLNARWTPNQTLTVRVSVRNAGNRQPPIVGGTIGPLTSNGGNTFPQNYDVLGRHITFGASVIF